MATKINQSSATSKREPVVIEWKDVNYCIRVRDSKTSTFLRPAYNYKMVLNGLSGTARSGELLAIMGPTG